MLLANKQVATYVYNYKKQKEKNTFVYRIHDFPDPEKVKDFSVFAKQFGHKMNVDENSISKSLNKLMEEIEGKPEQNILEQLAISHNGAKRSIPRRRKVTSDWRSSTTRTLLHPSVAIPI